MIRKITIAALIAVGLSSATLAETQTVYWDPAKGSDLNAGTKESPLKTYKAALQKLDGAGQIVNPNGVETFTAKPDQSLLRKMGVLKD